MRYQEKEIEVKILVNVNSFDMLDAILYRYQDIAYRARVILSDFCSNSKTIFLFVNEYQDSL